MAGAVQAIQNGKRLNWNNPLWMLTVTSSFNSSQVAIANRLWTNPILRNLVLPLDLLVSLQFEEMSMDLLGMFS